MLVEKCVYPEPTPPCCTTVFLVTAITPAMFTIYQGWPTSQRLRATFFSVLLQRATSYTLAYVIITPSFTPAGGAFLCSDIQTDRHTMLLDGVVAPLKNMVYGGFNKKREITPAPAPHGE